MGERAVPFVERPEIRLVARGFDWIEYTAPIELHKDVCERLASLVAAAKEGEVAPVYLGARRSGDEWQRQQRLDALPFVALP